MKMGIQKHVICVCKRLLDWPYVQSKCYIVLVDTGVLVEFWGEHISV